MRVEECSEVASMFTSHRAKDAKNETASPAVVQGLGSDAFAKAGPGREGLSDIVCVERGSGCKRQG